MSSLRVIQRRALPSRPPHTAARAAVSPSAACRPVPNRRLSLLDVELDSVDEGVVADRPGVGCSVPEAFKISLA